MKLNEYQTQAMRTKGDVTELHTALMIGGLGISGEAGEVSDYIKKVLFHGHKLDSDKIAKEIGDVLWYAAFLAEFIGIDLEEIARRNIEKLLKRYPNGFEKERSINREADE
jgi:NTP pyrophosphatase (non-canonical NTP hydrolase)